MTYNDDPLTDYHPNQQVPPPGSGYGTPASAFPPAAPADPEATPRIQPTPEADPDAFDKTLEDLDAKLVGSRITVRWTQAGISFGMPNNDLTLEQIFEATAADGKPLDPISTRALREAAVESLVAQAYAMSKENNLKLRAKLASEPAGVSSLHQLRYTPEQPAPAGVAAGTTAPAGAGAQAVAAVANGAETEDRWGYNPGFKGQGQFGWVKPKFLTSSDVEADGQAWLLEKGLDLRYFKVWDDRPGARGGRAVGEAMSSAANIKWSDAGKALLDANGLGALKNIAVARSMFNDDESLYWYFGKNQDANKSMDAFFSDFGRGRDLFKAQS